MNADLKAKWVAALQSGKYLKGRYYLKDSQGRYCCLGVLCEILGKPAQNGSNIDSQTLESVLYAPVRQVLDEGNVNTLASLNDNGLRSSLDTFEEVIEYIEASL